MKQSMKKKETGKKYLPNDDQNSANLCDKNPIFLQFFPIRLVISGA